MTGILRSYNNSVILESADRNLRGIAPPAVGRPVKFFSERFLRFFLQILPVIVLPSSTLNPT